MIMSTYAISDIHGNRKIADYVIQLANEGHTIYFLGDAADRGPDGWSIIKDFLRTPNIVYLMGNHEDMLIKAMRGYFMNDDEYIYSRAHEVWSWNGSQPTEQAILEENFDRALMYYSHLCTLPLTADYVNSNNQTIHMCHSGYPYWDNEDCQPTTNDIIWDREHYSTLTWWYGEDEFVIHGHTPIPYLLKDIDPNEHIAYEDGALHYCHGHKIDIDMLTILTGEACLIDLDTFEEIILEDTNNGQTQ